ncbi:AfsR/SARP family transcriptional regulator [Micromonospora saelicesensis]|uniref:DNA-binding transcriptional activator of the SARP family n=1 Tax=Micromonospora saelicesensis TaxID=285676 RepID=A0A1C4YNQ3_9ACTN|nr:AfsR/SARP family transcriptional regulator [Micromonospora saelicesensis]SCF22393.1 DNA-binding transcriptional activator of the SARP family [Micromonospora saelicesensis]
MRFGILGPLRVGGGESTVTAGRDRIVLAMLLLRAGRLVPVDELVDAVWEDRPPATARAQLQTCVSRLRRRFTELELAPDLIVTDPAGYGVRTAPTDLDAEVFTRGVDAARAAVTAGRLVDARAEFRAALALWRGPALGGIPSRSVRRRAQALDEQRLTALEECVDVELRLGRAAELIGELAESLDQHPVRERLRGQLMLALSAVGRQADALAVYREGRRTYADELGIEPGAELQELHQRVLAGDLALAGREARPTAPVRSLPRAIGDFTGRQQTMARLVKEVEAGARIQLIDGMAGSGKTTLAVHLATALAGDYPDAQLYIDLHGHSERTPLTPAAAVATLLRQLGVPAERVPTSQDDRLALWRSELAGRRALLVLDNAATADQVTPLLPNGSHCLILITSRRRLVGVDEGRPSSLPVLDSDEAVELLGRVVGVARVTAEPVAATEVVRRCGHLPLAIRLAGARLAHRPHWRIADLAERLTSRPDPLAEFEVGERSVGRAFALSYAQVSPVAQRAFRLLGLHPGVRFDTPVAAALTGQPLAKAQDLLDELVDANLVEETEPGRYRLHDLVREYARTLVAEPGWAGERRDGIEGLLDHHLHVATAIARTRELSSSYSLALLPEPARPDLVLPIVGQGRGWFDDNLAALTALVRLAETEGFPRHCWQLSRACWYAQFEGGHLDELVETHMVGLRVAEELGDETAMAMMLNYLASAHYRLGRFAESNRLMERALDVYRRLGLQSEVRNTLGNLGNSYVANGDYRRGRECLEAAAALARRMQEQVPLANNLNNLAMALLLWGRYDEALRTCRRHLALARELGDLRQIGNALGHLGMTRHRLGDGEPARRLLRFALRLKRKAGNRFGEGELLNEIGVLERVAGQPDHAAALHREALVAMADVGDRVGQCATRNLLARAMLEQGDAASALDLHRRVLDDASRLGARNEKARALEGIARCVRDTDPTAARAPLEQALALFRQIDSPERHEVERLLTELG